MSAKVNGGVIEALTVNVQLVQLIPQLAIALLVKLVAHEAQNVLRGV